MDTTPVSLLEQLRHPNAAPAAWGRFVDLYAPLLYRWGRGLGLQESDAVDLGQDVFGILVKELPKFSYRPDGSFRAWLKTIFRNRWRNTLKGQPVTLGGEQWAEIPDPNEDQKEELEAARGRGDAVESGGLGAGSCKNRGRPELDDRDERTSQ